MSPTVDIFIIVIIIIRLSLSLSTSISTVIMVTTLASIVPTIILLFLSPPTVRALS